MELAAKRQELAVALGELFDATAKGAQQKAINSVIEQIKSEIQHLESIINMINQIARLENEKLLNPKYAERIDVEIEFNRTSIELARVRHQISLLGSKDNNAVVVLTEEQNKKLEALRQKELSWMPKPHI